MHAKPLRGGSLRETQLGGDDVQCDLSRPDRPFVILVKPPEVSGFIKRLSGKH